MFNTLGHNIRQQRLAKGLTIAELAEKADASDSFISRLELGAVKNPHLLNVYSVAQALDVSLNVLFDNQTDTDPYTLELISKIESLPKEQGSEVSKHILKVLEILNS